MIQGQTGTTFGMATIPTDYHMVTAHRFLTH